MPFTNEVLSLGTDFLISHEYFCINVSLSIKVDFILLFESTEFGFRNRKCDYKMNFLV